MFDAALIQSCADPGLQPAIVERFIEQAGSTDPLAVSVRSGSRLVLVPRPRTADEALELIRQHLGRSVVRVGITQFPAGVGIQDASELSAQLVDPCENIRMGTALFAKVYRIVVKWYGNAVDEAFEDAIIAWQTGNFEGTAVFHAPDPGDVELAAPKAAEPAIQDDVSAEASSGYEEGPADRPAGEDAQRADPNKAGIRIDLSGIGARRP